MDDQLAFFVHVAVPHVRLDGQVGLALRVVAAFRHHVIGVGEEGSGFLPLHFLLLEVGVRGAGVDFDGVGSHRVRGVQVFGQQLEIEFDLVGGGAGVRFGVGAHDGEGVAVLEDFGIVQDGTIPAVTLVGREGDEAGDAVLALDVLVGQHAVHAGHGFRFGGVDAFDVGVGNLGLSQRQMQRVRRHLEGGIRAEVVRAGHLGDSVGTRTAGTPRAAVHRFLIFDVLNGFLAAHDGGGVHDGIDQRLVARAAAGVAVALEPVAHVVAGRGRVVVEQAFGGHDESGRTEAALRAAVEHPRKLQRVHMLGRADTFKGGDGGPVFNAFHFQRTGTYQLAVQNHITGTALTRAASDLHAGQQKLSAQHVGQRIFRIHQQRFRHAIHNESLGNHVPLLDSTASPPDGPNRRVSGYPGERDCSLFAGSPVACLDEYIRKPILHTLEARFRTKTVPDDVHLSRPAWKSGYVYLCI